MGLSLFDDFVRGTKVALVSPLGEKEAHWDIVRPSIGAQELMVRHMRALMALNARRAAAMVR